MKAKEIEMDALLTAEDLAVRYQVTGRTIRNWYNEGRIPAEVAIGRVLRFDPARVAAALRESADKAKDRVPGMCLII